MSRVTGGTDSAGGRFAATLRLEERVTALELFFDLVFVLAITQCTALMAASPTWTGLARGLLVLGVLWWSWVGYAWLTSVVEPEEGAVRIAIFAAMAGLLVAALCIPGAFSDNGMLFAVAYGIVRAGHIALFVIASRTDPGLRHAVVELSVSTAVGVGFLVAAATTDGALQGALWLAALLLDMSGPLLIDASNWRLAPGHFAERHGLIVIIALGESIVAIGVGAGATVDAGVVACALIAVALAASLWWVYFDVTAIAAERRLRSAPVGREQNMIARDSYSYLHFPMVAGIVLLALGLKTALAHDSEPLELVPAVALTGGVSLYLLALVAFRLRNMRSLSYYRLGCAVLVLGLIPVAEHIDSLATLALLTTITVGLVAYEAIRFSDARGQFRARGAVP
jgi:low temperature requirement protein LtrA